MIQTAFTWKLKNSDTLFTLESHFVISGGYVIEMDSLEK